jgi:uncharacterized metal-binding protein
MANCCGDSAKKQGSSAQCCGGAVKKNVLLYACSGGANVAEIADRAARELMFAGRGSMFCLAGIGAGIPAMIETAKKADLNVVIEGCPMDCAKKIFEKAGVTNYVQVKVTDLGIEKTKGVRATHDQIATVVGKVSGVIAQQA